MYQKMEKMGVMQFMKEIQIKEKRATTRMGYLPIGGGGLNASYTTVDAVANIFTEALDADAQVILGARVSEDLEDTIRVVTLLAGIQPSN